MTSDERRAEAHTVIDTVHDFYENIGIRGEKDIPGTLLFRQRLIHTTIAAAARSHRRALPNGFFDPTDRTFLSGGMLLDTMLADLVKDPL